ncbi:sugar transporter SWEET1 isoform X5 [Caretta caretta]|uniref:sugar transporter SWEET1 isoform X5 n=1 Tax=Caretta caretta TaxID=8467 RepID=UPI00209550C4|nr:sugar transporter SWEET1 isoform X4 [Caretta caretta]XP_048690124.1 sugar transporter SWEET1-like isoform X2 [Caretta caretta]
MEPPPLPLLSGACVACTLGMFATGLTDLRQMFRTRSVENIQFLPFLTTDVNNLSWLSYGCLKQDWTLITVNAIGAALQTLYILVYLYFSPEKAKVIRTRSTRCLSFPLTVATFLASASWTLYGLQLNDLYIMVPNVPGIVTSILRLWLFWQFPPDQDKLYKPLQA